MYKIKKKIYVAVVTFSNLCFDLYVQITVSA